MEIKELLKIAREIWGEDRCSLSQIIVRMRKVFGDICRWERNEKKDKEFHIDEELKRNWVILFFQLFGGVMIWVMIRKIALISLLNAKKICER